jgi:hypothetical protein
MMLSVEKSVEAFSGEIEVLGGSLPQCKVVRHKFHMA